MTSSVDIPYQMGYIYFLHLRDNDYTYSILQLLLYVVLFFSSVMFPDDKNIAVGCWDSRTGEKLQSLSSGMPLFAFVLNVIRYYYNIC